jgi:putative ATP-binding cassette transporter
VPADAEKSGIEMTEDETRVAFERLTLATPDDGRVLIENLSLNIPPGSRLLILGPDGSGRTSLMRATAGLWKAGQGRVVRPPAEQMMFLIQQPT